MYRSKANPNLGGSQIAEILEKARRNNKQKDITGCLLFYNEHFIQYLEGEQHKVMTLYDRIQQDDRHFDITLLSSTQIEEREFGSWDMAYENLFGNNCQLHYLKLLVSSFIDDADSSYGLNPTSIHFWKATKKLLEDHRKLSDS
ncbi:BLUF domain-containing protein [Aggregatimonas sangjinii]|nr:BLUF domain-containing protein [Aggregatimonas sangjinii]